MTHDEGWQFLRAGRALERAEKTARIVDVEYHTLLEGRMEHQPDHHQWMAVLKSVAAYEMYRREFHSSIDPRKVAQLLVLHAGHPRSIRFNIAELQASLQAISLAAPGTYVTEAERCRNCTERRSRSRVEIASKLDGLREVSARPQRRTRANQTG